MHESLHWLCQAILSFPTIWSQFTRLLPLRCLHLHWMPSSWLYAPPYPVMCVANLILTWIAPILVEFLLMNLICVASPGPSRMLPNWTVVLIVLHLTPCNAIALVIFINLLLLLLQYQPNPGQTLSGTLQLTEMTTLFIKPKKSQWKTFARAR